MRRDQVSIRRRHNLSSDASTRFFALVDAMAEHQTPTATQLDALKSSYESTAEFLSTREEFAETLIQIHPHGSRQLGTLTKPIDDSRNGFDVDLIARFNAAAWSRYSDYRGPARLLDQIYAALADYARAHQLELQRHDRCVTLHYAGGMCADIAPVIDSPRVAIRYGETHGLIPDKAVRSFESTNPRGYTRFFNEAAAISPRFPSMEKMTAAMDSARKADIVPLPDARDVFDRLLCRFVQVIKLHRNFRFGLRSGTVDLRPTSVFVTTLAAQAYAIQAPQAHASPLDLLLDVVETMPRLFARVPLGAGLEEWQLPNPAAPQSNLAAEMNLPLRQIAFDRWIEQLMQDIEAVIDAIEARAGMNEVVSTVENGFGARSGRAVRDALFAEQQATREAGKARLFTGTPAPLVIPSRQHRFFGN